MIGSRLSEEAGDNEEGEECFEGEGGPACVEAKVGREGLHGEGRGIPPPGRGAPMAANMWSG